jgi:catechol-2,3-dioxygenase
MTAHVRNIVIECPDPEALAGFYARLLDLPTLRRPPDWMVIGREDGGLPRLAFDPVEDYHPPRWPDPAHPQQLHLDITVPVVAAAAAWLRDEGATWLEDGTDCQVWADPAGHPFCLCEDATHGPQISAIVMDCENHSDLAGFYASVLGLHQTTHEWDDWWIALDSGDGPVLAFAKIAEHRRPRWPDPSYPQQMHLDIGTDDPATLQAAERLGAERLPDLGGSCPVYADPAGHPFCLCAPGE